MLEITVVHTNIIDVNIIIIALLASITDVWIISTIIKFISYIGSYMNKFLAEF